MLLRVWFLLFFEVYCFSWNIPQLFVGLCWLIHLIVGRCTKISVTVKPTFWKYKMIFKYLLCVIQFTWNLYTRPPQIFFGKLEQTPQWSLGQNVTGHQFSANSDVVWPRLRSSKVGHFSLKSLKNGQLRSFGGVVKRHSNWLKIGVQSHFGPNSTVEFEAWFQKFFGVAYWPAVSPDQHCGW